MNTPSTLFYSTAHGWKSNGIYGSLGTARNATSGSLGLAWNDKVRYGAQILKAEGIQWNVVDEITVGMTRKELPWNDKRALKIKRLRARADRDH